MAIEVQLNKLFKNITKSVKTIGIEDTNKAIEENMSKKEVQDLGVSEILETISKHFEISTKDLINSRERGEVQKARDLACYFFCVQGNMSYRDVAKGIFNRPNHIFVFNGVKKHKERFAQDKKYRGRFNSINIEINTKL